MDVIYYLSLVPLLLITLIVHETGHLLAARLMKVKVSAFQIGAGRKLFTFHTGRTPINLSPATRYHLGAQETPAPGDIINIHITQEQDLSYTAVAIHPAQPSKTKAQDQIDPMTAFAPFIRVFRRPKPDPQPPTLTHYNQTHMMLTGRVNTITGSTIFLSDLECSLRPIPVMAGVFMPEDPSQKVSNAYNTVPLRKQALITIAGPAANLLLLVLTLAALAVIPLPTPRGPIIAIDHVSPASPADKAGIHPGDYIIQINHTLIPTKQELTQEISSSMLTGKPLTLHVKRQQENLTFRITPELTTGHLGITITEYIPPHYRPSIHPAASGQRFAKLTTAYFNATMSLITSIGDPDNHDPVLSSPVMTAYYTAQAVEHAHLRAWLAILAVLSMGCAFLNLLPIPPLDGYHLAIQSIQSVRKRKPISPTIERAVTVSGLSIIITATLYLIMADIIRLLE